MSNEIQYAVENKKYKIEINEAKSFSLASIATLKVALNYSAISLEESLEGQFKRDMAFQFDADLSKARLLLKLLGVKLNSIEQGNLNSENIITEFVNYDSNQYKEFKQKLAMLNNSKQDNSNLNSQVKKILDSLKAEVKDFEAESKPIYASYNYDSQMQTGNMDSFNNLFAQLTGSNTRTKIPAEKLGIFSKYYDETKANNFNHVIKLYSNNRAVYELILDVNLPLRFKFYGFWSEEYE